MAYKDLAVEDVENFLKQPDVVLIDTRDIHSYRAGHIEGAQHIDGPTMGKLIKKRKACPPVLVYCYHGNMSRDVAQMISGFGFDNVSHIVGGWEAWNKHKSALSSKSSTYTAEDFLGMPVANLSGA